MNKTIVFVGFFLLYNALPAQDKVDSLVRLGTDLHEAGQYIKAIDTYRGALDVDPDSPLTNYKIALAYMDARLYKNAIKSSEKVISLNNGLVPEAYVTKGSCLNYLGQIARIWTPWFISAR